MARALPASFWIRSAHLLFSNKLDDNAPLDQLRRAGYSIDDAITELLRRRGHEV